MRRALVSLALVTLMLLMVPHVAGAATTTEKTGPITTHVPQTYVYNLGPNDDGEYRELYNKATGEHIAWGIDDGKCPILLPGDTVEVIPEPNVPNGHMAKGLSLVNNDNYPQATHYESRGPIEVVKTQTWGGYPFITELRNRSTYPVRIWSNGGGDCASEEVSDDVWYVYSQSGLDFVYFKASVPLRYEYISDDEEDRSFTDDEIANFGYYTDEENTTLVYAEDALVNRYAESNETLGVTVYRPYIEGYLFDTGNACWENNSKVYDYRGPYWEETVDGIAYNKGNGWYDNAAEIYPQWTNAGGDNQTLIGSDTDYLLMRCIYDFGRTLTLDANGGTIDGYPKRIYEATGRYFDDKLSDGAMDAELAAGTAWTPVREGWVFCGWCEDEACTTPITSFKETLSEYRGNSDDISQRACRLYAKWQPVQKDISGAKITGLSSKTYTGKAITQKPVVKLDDATLVEGTDYTVSYKNNTNAGTATVTITGTGNYTGTAKATFTIAKADLKGASIAAIAEQGYTGSAIKPSPAVKLDGTTLVKGTDYTLSYKSNTKVGTATITVTGKGNYTGTKSASFKIVNWSGASKIPVSATAKYTCLKDGYLRVKSGSKFAKSNDILSVSGWTITGKKAGKTTLYLFDKGGKQVASKTVEVFTAHGKTYEFESSVDKSYVLDIQGGSKKDGAQMIVYQRNGGDNQKYQLYLQKDGSYGIRSKKSSKWLTVESKTNKYVQQMSWSGAKSQLWRITVDASNRVTFVNVGQNKCFDVQGGKTKNSAKMIVWDYNGGLNQKWKLNQK